MERENTPRAHGQATTAAAPLGSALQSGMADFENGDVESSHRESSKAGQRGRVEDEPEARRPPAVTEGSTPIATLKLRRPAAGSEPDRCTMCLRSTPLCGTHNPQYMEVCR